jgi:HAD superfamily hydrolase (TIGR01549 family)
LSGKRGKNNAIDITSFRRFIQEDWEGVDCQYPQPTIINKMLKAVFFDIGKTIVDDPFPKAKHSVGQYLVNERLLDPSQQGTFLDTLTLANSNIDSYEFSHFWGEIRIFEYGLSCFGISNKGIATQVLRIYRQQVKYLYETDITLRAMNNEELANLLSWMSNIKQLKLGIISDERISSVGLYWDVLKCGTYFKAIVTSEEVGCCKPCESIFRYALEKSEVDAEDSLYVGDNPARDIAGANAVGMNSVLSTQFTGIISTEECKYAISRLSELKPLVESLC